MGGDRPPRSALIATALVVVLMGLSTVAHVEAWPLGPWELFSGTRRQVQRSVIAKFVEDGRETQISFGSLPYQYSGAHAVLGGFMKLPSAEKRAVCVAWATALQRAGERPERIRIYRLERRLRLDGRPPGRREELAHECLLDGGP